jgi:Transposase and inactivated derivatives
MQKPMIALDKILFVGMDIHKDNHSACLTDCFGRRLKNLEISSDAQGFSRLLAEVGKLAETEGLKPVFGLEDSYGLGLRLANFLKQSGQEIKSVSPVLVDRKRRYETHPEKSDSLDAFGVAKVLIEKIDSLPAYSISKQTSLSKQLREINNDRRFLVAEQTRLKNQLHVLLHRNYGSAYKQPFKNVFSLKAMKYWRRHPCPSKKESCIAVDDYSLLAAKQIRRKISRLLSIREELKEIELELKDLVGKSGQKLETLNGCGTVLAAAVLGEIKDIDSFKSPGSLAKYAGLAPREKSSGKSRKLIKSRSGNRRLNQAIHHIALSQIGRNGNETAKKYFQKKISGGKSKVQALCCLKRRLADIIYLMLKHKQEYNYHAAD